LFSLVAEGATMLPPAFDTCARKAELLAAWLLGKQAATANPVRRSMATYLHAAGIQAGYTFFAPNIPGYHKLIFELNYQDGRIERWIARIRCGQFHDHGTLLFDVVTAAGSILV